MLVYTNIQHGFRKKHNLSCNEYVFCDMVYFLSTRPDAHVKGWCYASKESLGEEIGLSRQSIINLTNKLTTDGFLEKDEHTKFLRTTPKWNEAYFTECKESLQPDKNLAKSSKESLQNGRKESLHYNNTNTNTSNKNTETPAVLFPVSSSEVSSAPVQTELDIKFTAFQKWIMANAPNVLKMTEPLTKAQFEGITKKYAGRNLEVQEVLKAMHNNKALLRKYISANLTIQSWMGLRTSKGSGKYKAAGADQSAGFNVGNQDYSQMTTNT